MKKVIFENGLKAFLATAFLLLLGVGSVMAQGKLTSVAIVPGVSNPPAPSSPIYDVPQGVFVGSAVASDKLDLALVQLKADMEQVMTSNPALFNTYMVKYRYYGKIQEHLKSGADTANAIAAGMWIFLESVEYAAIPSSEQAALKQAAINLLS